MLVQKCIVASEVSPSHICCINSSMFLFLRRTISFSVTSFSEFLLLLSYIMLFLPSAFSLDVLDFQIF